MDFMLPAGAWPPVAAPRRTRWPNPARLRNGPCAHRSWAGLAAKLRHDTDAAWGGAS